MEKQELELGVEAASTYLEERFGAQLVHTLQHADYMENWSQDSDPAFRAVLEEARVYLEQLNGEEPMGNKMIEALAVTMCFMSAIPRTRLLVHMIDVYGADALGIIDKASPNTLEGTSSLTLSHFLGHLKRKNVLQGILAGISEPTPAQ